MITGGEPASTQNGWHIYIVFRIDLLCWDAINSVGRARVPCAEALQRTRAQLPARVPLLHVTLPLPVSCHPLQLHINKAIKAQKYFKKELTYYALLKMSSVYWDMGACILPNSIFVASTVLFMESYVLKKINVCVCLWNCLSSVVGL